MAINFNRGTKYAPSLIIQEKNKNFNCLMFCNILEVGIKFSYKKR